MDVKILKQAKQMGFSDKYIAKLWNKQESDIYLCRKQNKIYPSYRMINTCPIECERYVPYFYSTYNGENDLDNSLKDNENNNSYNALLNNSNDNTVLIFIVDIIVTFVGFLSRKKGKACLFIF